MPEVKEAGMSAESSPVIIVKNSDSDQSLSQLSLPTNSTMLNESRGKMEWKDDHLFDLNDSCNERSEESNVKIVIPIAPKFSRNPFL